MFPRLANYSRDVVFFLQMVLQLFTWCWLIMTLYRMALRFIESLVGGVQLGQTLTEGLGKDLFLEEVSWPPLPNLAFPPSRLLVMGCRPPPSGLEQVWSLTQFYSVDFSKSRICVKKCVFYKRTIKVCVSCFLMVSLNVAHLNGVLVTL